MCRRLRLLLHSLLLTLSGCAHHLQAPPPSRSEGDQLVPIATMPNPVENADNGRKVYALLKENATGPYATFGSVGYAILVTPRDAERLRSILAEAAKRGEVVVNVEGPPPTTDKSAEFPGRAR